MEQSAVLVSVAFVFGTSEATTANEEHEREHKNASHDGDHNMRESFHRYGFVDWLLGCHGVRRLIVLGVV